MKQAVMEEAAQVNKKYTVTLTPRFSNGSLMAVRGGEPAVGCRLWPTAGWPARPLPRPSSKVFVRNERGLVGQAGGKSPPPKRVRASLLILWCFRARAPAVAILKLLGGKRPQPAWRRWGVFPTAQTSLQLICASCSPDLTTRRPCKTCNVLPCARKVTPRLEFDK